MLKDFSNEIGSNINEYEFLILYNEMHQHLEDLQNSVNQYCTKKKKIRSVQCYKHIHDIHSKYKINGF